jgi:hypothetical protein
MRKTKICDRYPEEKESERKTKAAGLQEFDGPNGRKRGSGGRRESGGNDGREMKGSLRCPLQSQVYQINPCFSSCSSAIPSPPPPSDKLLHGVQGLKTETKSGHGGLTLDRSILVPAQNSARLTMNTQQRYATDNRFLAFSCRISTEITVGGILVSRIGSMSGLQLSTLRQVCLVEIANRIRNPRIQN